MVNNKLKKIDNLAGKFAINLLRPFSRQLQNQPQIDISKVQEVLFIKTVGIGDLILLLPAIKHLKDSLPEIRITLLTNGRTREVVEGQPFIDEVIYWTPESPLHGLTSLISIYRKIARKFDLIIDAEHYYNFSSILSFLSKPSYRIGFSMDGQDRKRLFSHPILYEVRQHEVWNFMALTRALVKTPTQINLISPVVSESDRSYVDVLLKDVPQNKLLVVVHPGTSDSAKSRRWPIESFKQLTSRLVEELGVFILLTGSSEEKQMLDELIDHRYSDSIVSLAGKCSINQLVDVINRTDAFLSCDTGPLHIAATTNVPVVGLFGPNVPEKWGPHGAVNKAIYKALECSPCIKQYEGKITECADNKCMQAILVDEVFQAIKKMVSKRL